VIRGDWASLPLTMLTNWMHVELPTSPLRDDEFVAAQALSESTGQQKRDRPGVNSASNTSTGWQRSAVICLMPTKDPDAAINYSSDEADAVRLAHWIVADMVRAIRAVTRLPIVDLTYTRLPPLIPTTHAVVHDGLLVWSGQQRLVVLDTLARRLPPDRGLSRAEVELVGQAFGNLTWGRVGATVLDHYLRGNAAAANGDDLGAVLGYATASEVSLTNLVLALMWEEQVDPIEAADQLRDESVTRMTVARCSKLGGNWRTDRPGAVSDWRIHVAELRNRILHDGASPTTAEVETARAAAKAIGQHISKRLVASWKKYPHTLALLVSRSSVDRYASKKAHARIVAIIEEQCLDSEAEFGEWRKRFRKASEIRPGRAR
jgi:hypothetical protein